MTSDALEQFRSEWKRDLETSKVKPRGDKANSPRDKSTSTNSALERIRSEGPSNTEKQSGKQQKKAEVAVFVATRPSTGGDAVSSEPFSEAQSGELHEVTAPETEKLSALQVYEIAVEKERQGLLTDALTNYRKAFKLDASVDQQFRSAFRAGNVQEAAYDNAGSSVEDTNYAKFIQVGHDYDPKKPHEPSSELQDMVTMMSALRMPILTEPVNQTSDGKGIDALPEEILYQILTYATVSSSAAAFPALSATCQKFFILLHDHTIWKKLCLVTYIDQVYTGEGISLSSASAHADYLDKITSEVEEHYNSDWKRMFIEKPRVRYDGIYIATCHYTRPGVREESLDWTSPVHLVTYFRFLRFYPSGKCLSLLTPAQPQEVVHSIQLGTKLKGVQQGRWSMTRTGQLSIEANGPSNYLFFMDLQVKSSSRGRHNKLTWSRFSGVHPVTAEVTQFNLKNDRSHYFHKVKSYGTV